MKSMQRKELAKQRKKEPRVRHNWPRRERKVKGTTQYENESRMNMQNWKPGHLEV